MNNTDQELRDKATQIIESVIDWSESGRTTVGRSNAIEPQVAVDILIKLITTNFIPLEEHNRKVAEAETKKMLALAEAQLLGYSHGVHGYSLNELIESMALTVDEWEKIKSQYPLQHLTKDDIAIIDAQLKQQLTNKEG